MSTRQALLDAIRRNREDDTPRLIYADYLDGDADPPEPERAELIRVQCELAKLGPPHLSVDEPAVIESAGPDYWIVSGGARVRGGSMLIVDAKPGCRVDLLKPRGYSNKKLAPMYGLRFSKFTGDNDDNTVLVRDSESHPWGGDELRRRESSLFADPHPVGDYRIYGNRLGWTEDIRQWGHEIEWYRGFVKKFECKWQDWSAHAAAILPEHPGLERVTLTTPPSINLRWREMDVPHGMLITLDAEAAGMRGQCQRILDRHNLPHNRSDIEWYNRDEMRTEMSHANLLKLWWGGDPKEGGWGVTFNLPRPGAHGDQYRHWSERRDDPINLLAEDE